MLSLKARSEHGASAILIAGSLFLLIGMAAIAIDVGAGFNERRQSQTAADVGVLAGALDFDDPAEIVAQALEFVRRNISTTYADINSGDYAATWTSCADPNRPETFSPLPMPDTWPGWAPGATIACLSQSPGEVRLRLPDQFVATSFGRVLGINELQTSAFAVASVAPSNPGRGVLPFAIRGTQGAGEACLKTGSSGTAQPPCTGSTAGSFGTVISPAFGNEFFATTPQCNKNAVLAQNIAVGIDHLIVPYVGTDWSGFPISGQPPGGNVVRNSDANIDACQQTGPPGSPAIPVDGVPINAVEIDTGNVQTPMTSGLVSNDMFIGGTYPSRLQNTDGNGPTRRIRSQANNWDLDNTPLYMFLTEDASDKVLDDTYSIDGESWAACDHDSYTGTGLDEFQKTELMVACLVAHQGQFPESGENPNDDSAAVIFEDGIGESARFAWAPRVFHAQLPNGVGYDPIYDFKMVYLAGVFFNCGNQGCDAIFYADTDVTNTLCVPTGNSCRQLGVDQVTGFVMSRRSVSADVRATFPFGTLEPSFAPILVR